MNKQIYIINLIFLIIKSFGEYIFSNIPKLFSIHTYYFLFPYNWPLVGRDVEFKIIKIIGNDYLSHLMKNMNELYDKKDSIYIKLFGMTFYIVNPRSELAKNIQNNNPSDETYNPSNIKMQNMKLLAPSSLVISTGCSWEHRRDFVEKTINEFTKDRNILFNKMNKYIEKSYDKFSQKNYFTKNDMIKFMGEIGLKMLIGENNIKYYDELPIDISLIFDEVNDPISFLTKNETIYEDKKKNIYKKLLNLWNENECKEYEENSIFGIGKNVLVSNNYNPLLLRILEQYPHFLFTYTNSGCDLLFNTLLMIASRINVQEKLKSELLNYGVNDNDNDNDKNIMNYINNKYTYLEGCIREIGRLFPPVNLFTNKKKENEMYLQLAILNNRNTVNDNLANYFCPLRWMDEERRKESDNKFPLLFSYGSRICPGREIIMIVIKKIIIKFVTKTLYIKSDETTKKILAKSEQKSKKYNFSDDEKDIGGGFQYTYYRKDKKYNQVPNDGIEPLNSSFNNNGSILYLNEEMIINKKNIIKKSDTFRMMLNIFDKIITYDKFTSIYRYIGSFRLLFQREIYYKNNKNLISIVKNYPNDENREIMRNGRDYDGYGNNPEYKYSGNKDDYFIRNIDLYEKNNVMTSYHYKTDKLINLLSIPNPHLISEKLLKRDKFKSVPGVNFLTCAWIQFMIHDWFDHYLHDEDYYEINDKKILKTVIEEKGMKNRVTGWWDGSQIYGSDKKTNHDLRTFSGGKLKLPNNILPTDELYDNIPEVGFGQNWWIGLELFHTLFIKEHNYICDKLKEIYPSFNDEELFMKARLINSAQISKIHTIEWTTTVLDTDVLYEAMNSNWSGLLRNKNPFIQLLRKIIEKNAAYHGILFSDKLMRLENGFNMSEEFVSVYRMHSLLRDDIIIKNTKYNLVDTIGSKSHKFFKLYNLGDIIQSFGTCEVGALCLNNYPNFMTNLDITDVSVKEGGCPIKKNNNQKINHDKIIDMGAIDIIRDRERGIPSYNEFRRRIGLKPVTSFEELVKYILEPNEELKELERQKIIKILKEIYNDDVELVDRLIGSLVEERNIKNLFGDSSFYIFIIMASGRLMFDRFYTIDYNEKTYTQFGLNYIDQSTLKDIIKRHTGLNTPKDIFKMW